MDEEQIRLCYVYAMEAGTADVGPLQANSRTVSRSQSREEGDLNGGQAGLKLGRRPVAHIYPAFRGALDMALALMESARLRLIR